jgi:phosphoribosylformylglycinamidine cyclo-ligase
VTRLYAEAGVDLEGAEAAKARIARAVAGTRTALSAGRVGAFGGMVRIPAGMRRPTLVLSTDGVGTKVLVALEAGRFDTVGEDLVNHSVNDILVHGATPIAFMDYIAGSGLGVEQIAGIVEGIARGCRTHEMALAGGETAQMPGLYQPGTYDLAGTIIGVVEEDAAIHGDAIRPGDVLLGYASTGLHTNGYTLARRLLGLTGEPAHDRPILAAGAPGLDGSVGDALMAVHRSYLGVVGPLLDAGLVAGIAHITGGGLIDNVPRMLPAGLAARFRSGAWPVPPIFEHLRRLGDLAPAELYRVFNMGLGMALACAPENAAAVARLAPEAILVGEVVESVNNSEKVTIES